MSRIKITAGDVVAFGELNETATAEAIWNALPLEAQVNTWGDEIYFSIPVHLGEENAQAVVEKGDLGYWPAGNAFCIFYSSSLPLHNYFIAPSLWQEIVLMQLILFSHQDILDC